MLPMSQVQTRTKLRPATKLNSFLRCLGWWLQTSLLSKHLHFIHVLLDTQAGSQQAGPQQGTKNNHFLHFPFKHTTPVAFHQHTSL